MKKRKQVLMNAAYAASFVTATGLAGGIRVALLASISVIVSVTFTSAVREGLVKRRILSWQETEVIAQIVAKVAAVVGAAFCGIKAELKHRDDRIRAAFRESIAEAIRRYSSISSIVVIEKIEKDAAIAEAAPLTAAVGAAGVAILGIALFSDQRFDHIDCQNIAAGTCIGIGCAALLSGTVILPPLMVAATAAAVGGCATALLSRIRM